MNTNETKETPAEAFMAVCRWTLATLGKILLFPARAAVKTGLAQNIITSAIGYVITLFIASGLMLVCYGSFTTGLVGMIFMIAGVLAVYGGWRVFPPDPPTVGAITIYDTIYTGTPTGDDEDDNGQTLAVSGDTLLAPYWPFKISAISVDMTRKEWVFPMVILSAEGTDPKTGKPNPPVPMNAEAHITVVPNKQELDDYIQSGGLKNIEAQMAQIAHQEIQRIINKVTYGDHTGMSSLEIVQDAKYISDIFDKILRGPKKDAPTGSPNSTKAEIPELPGQAISKYGIFGEKAWGIKCTKVQVKTTLPKEISDAMVDASATIYKNNARRHEYDGDLEAMVEFKKALGITDPIVAKDIYTEARLVHDQMVQQVQFVNKGGGKDGNGIPIVVESFHVNLGNKGGKGDKGGGGKGKGKGKDSNKNT